MSTRVRRIVILFGAVLAVLFFAGALRAVLLPIIDRPDPGSTGQRFAAPATETTGTAAVETTPSVTDASFSFLVAGDPQIGASGDSARDSKAWATTVDTAHRWFPDARLLITLGDQVDSASSQSQYEGFLGAPALSALTLRPNIGNHDSSSSLFRRYFTLPNEASNAGDTPAGGDYWFSEGSVLFMSLNSNNPSVAQHKAFMERAILTYRQGSGGAEPLWKIVTFHHSIYSAGPHATSSDISRFRTELAPVLSSLGVDAVFAGHDHSYTRSWMMEGTTPVRSGYQTDRKGDSVSYTKSAGGAEVLYLTAGSASGSKYYPLRDAHAPYVAVARQIEEPTVMEVEVSAVALTCTTYRIASGERATTDEVVDAFTVRRPTGD